MSWCLAEGCVVRLSASGAKGGSGKRETTSGVVKVVMMVSTCRIFEGGPRFVCTCCSVALAVGSLANGAFFILACPHAHAQHC